MQKVSEVAKELKVSRQRVQQVIASLPRQERPKKLSGRYMINDKEKEIIASKLTRKTSNKSGNTELVSVLKQQTADKDKQIEILNQRLDKAEKRQAELTELLKRSQVLQQQSESRLSELTTTRQNKPQNDVVSNSSEDLNNLYADTKKKPEHAPKGFFSWLFKN